MFLSLFSSWTTRTPILTLAVARVAGVQDTPEVILALPFPALNYPEFKLIW